MTIAQLSRQMTKHFRLFLLEFLQSSLHTLFPTFVTSVNVLSDGFILLPTLNTTTNTNSKISTVFLQGTVRNKAAPC